ncbi:3D domain-containing protein [Rossellomorea marisflavi]|uniref:3D domain-containing protein n=1 Tax=Rossellomorea marisflavi TaxID=189381 RepID=UPI003F9F4628
MMKKIRRRVAGVIVVSMLMGSNVATLAAYSNQNSKINKYKETVNEKRKDLEANNRSLREEVFKKNNQLHNQDGEIENYKASVEDYRKKVKNLKKEIEKIERTDPPSKPKEVSRGEVKKSNVQRYEVTAYTSGIESTGKRPGDPSYGITASGERVQEGVTIACPKHIPFGTKMKIEKVGYRVCKDTGSDITYGRIDVYMDSLSAAQSFGRQSLMVEIVE